jgi:hypothetical protein
MRRDLTSALVGGDGRIQLSFRKKSVSKVKEGFSQTRRAADSFLKRVLCLLIVALAQIYLTQEIVSPGRVRELQQISVQPLLGFRQVSLLH